MPTALAAATMMMPALSLDLNVVMAITANVQALPL
jgi:hypothetical protein